LARQSSVAKVISPRHACILVRLAADQRAGSSTGQAHSDRALFGFRHPFNRGWPPTVPSGPNFCRQPALPGVIPGRTGCSGPIRSGSPPRQREQQM